MVSLTTSAVVLTACSLILTLANLRQFANPQDVAARVEGPEIRARRRCGLGRGCTRRLSGTATVGAMPAPEMIRVFLLDDHEVVRRGLRDLLEGEGDIEIVGESGLAQEAIARIPALRPHVAVLDARLPDGSGIDVCRQVRSVDPDIRALILTSYDDDEALFAAILAGASGYVLKQIASSDLVDGVRRVAAGQSLIDRSLTEKVLDRLRNRPGEPEELSTLTDQERKILALIAEGLTNRQIGERMFLAEKTVKNYVSSILSKLGLERRTQAAVLAAKLLGS
ncbi:hypothetical protein BH18ACT9_BH18ACT9_14650 [soil metagenome]